MGDWRRLVTTEKSAWMQKVDTEIEALRGVCTALDKLDDEAARIRVLAAVICLYDTETAKAAIRDWRRRVG
jgi:hypothetical protein